MFSRTPSKSTMSLIRDLAAEAGPAASRPMRTAAAKRRSERCMRAAERLNYACGMRQPCQPKSSKDSAFVALRGRGESALGQKLPGINHTLSTFVPSWRLRFHGGEFE